MIIEYKNVTVRPAREGDAQAILEITQEAFNKYAFDLGRRELVYALQDTVEDVEADIRNKKVYIALLEGEPVGTIRYENLADTAFVSRFGVMLKAQSNGVGGALVRRVLKDAACEGYPAVTLHTSAKMSSLIRFYYGCGFYIRCTNTSRGYVRALLVNELAPGCELDWDALMP